LKLPFASAPACLAVTLAAVTHQIPASGQTNALSAEAGAAPAQEQLWNWHVQNTDIVQYHPGFTAPYSGPNSLNSASEVKETVSLDILLGVRLWPGAEFHVDALMWQGFGLSDARGIDGFPNGEAFRLGTDVPNGAISRIFIRQTIGLGGEQESVEDDQLQLAGKRDISCITLTLGRISAKDIPALPPKKWTHVLGSERKAIWIKSRVPKGAGRESATPKSSSVRW
jgi:high affinity Mn2+ porin